mmetsp:Transcript_9101/g.16404  ORF Transcript_9101/g.16404 Transcript_9101/m.16404 type:complete len:249 (+) Transcript_9101:156-902(+)
MPPPSPSLLLPLNRVHLQQCIRYPPLPRRVLHVANKLQLEIHKLRPHIREQPPNIINLELIHRGDRQVRNAQFKVAVRAAHTDSFHCAIVSRHDHLRTRREGDTLVRGAAQFDGSAEQRLADGLHPILRCHIHIKCAQQVCSLELLPQSLPVQICHERTRDLGCPQSLQPLVHPGADHVSGIHLMQQLSKFIRVPTRQSPILRPIQYLCNCPFWCDVVKCTPLYRREPQVVPPGQRLPRLPLQGMHIQ